MPTTSMSGSPASASGQDLADDGRIVDDQDADFSADGPCRSFRLEKSLRGARCRFRRSDGAVDCGLRPGSASFGCAAGTSCGAARRKVALLSTRLSTEPQIMLASSQTTSPICCSDRSAFVLAQEVGGHRSRRRCRHTERQPAGRFAVKGQTGDEFRLGRRIRRLAEAADEEHLLQNFVYRLLQAPRAAMCQSQGTPRMPSSSVAQDFG